MSGASLAEEPLIILGARGGGGSGLGISYYQKLLGCVRRSTLSKGSDDDEETEDSATGKAVHALLEHYHLDRGGVAVPFQTSNGDPAIAEALRLFAAYRATFQPHSLGKVEGAEVPLSGSYGGIPVTARVDMVVRLDIDSMERIRQERGCDLSDMEPGIYLVDHKVKRAHTQDLVLNFQTSPQAMHYQNLWNLTHPTDPCRGMLFNVIFRYKVIAPKMFKLVPTPPPGIAEVAMVESIVRDGDRQLRERGEMWANPIHCFDYHRTCPHFWYCDRTNK